MTLANCNGDATCDACFQTVDKSYCFTYTGDLSNGSCPLILTNTRVPSQTQTAQTCQAWCASNSDVCYDAAREYCSGLNTPLGACSCLTPSLATQWKANGTVTEYSDAVALSNLEIPAKCMWGACFAGAPDPDGKLPVVGPSKNVLIERSTIQNCPKGNVVYCSVNQVSVTADDVRAQNLNLVKQQCSATGNGAESNPSSSSSNHKVSLAIALSAVGAVLIGIFIMAIILRKKSGGKYVHRVVVSPPSEAPQAQAQANQYN